MIRKRITDPRSLGSGCIKGTDKSTLGKDSSVCVMNHDPSNLGSMILFRNIPKTLIDNGKLANQPARLQAIVVKIYLDIWVQLVCQLIVLIKIGISKSLFLSEYLIEDMVAKRDCFFPYPSSSLPKRLSKRT